MRKPEELPPFCKYLQDQLDRREISHETLGKAIGVSKQAVGKMMMMNAFPRAHVAVICKLAGIPFSTVVQVQQRYDGRWYDPPRASSKSVPLEKLLKDLKANQENPDETVAAMIAALSPHAMFIKSRTVIPSPLIPTRTHTITSCYEAMDAGLLMGFFLPTAQHIARLRTEPSLPYLESYEEFQSRFVEFRTGYLKHRKSAGGDAEGYVSRHLQLFECDEYRTVTCGRVTTLLVESDGRGNPLRWVLERGPGSEGQVTLIPNNIENVERECVMTNWVLTKAKEMDCSPERKEFISRALLRMLGKSEEEFRSR